MTTSTLLHAQQRDFVCQTGMKVSKSIHRAWELSLGSQASFNQNMREMWFAYSDVGAAYHINRNLTTEIHSRNIRFRRLDNQYARRQLFYHTISWSKSFGKFGVSVRNRVQQLVYGEYFDDNYKNPRWYNRDRVQLRYRFNYYWSAYASGEVLIPLNHTSRKGIDQFRIASGINYTCNDFIRFDVYYQLQQQLQRTSGNNTYFVLGLNTSISIP
jgi:hypothetical protein